MVQAYEIPLVLPPRALPENIRGFLPVPRNSSASLRGVIAKITRSIISTVQPLIFLFHPLSAVRISEVLDFLKQLQIQYKLIKASIHTADGSPQPILGYVDTEVSFQSFSKTFRFYIYYFIYLLIFNELTLR